MIFICARPAPVQWVAPKSSNPVTNFLWKFNNTSMTLWNTFPLSLFSRLERAIVMTILYTLAAYAAYKCTPQAVVEMQRSALRFLVDQASSMKAVAS
ncbi:hypothetical protein FIBSPDRAFT_947955 [Athelia psychrophila]|uniref:Uncharacterized protein n=1 Tax=Athelia psychrophila TaxID=1759441 RepID=A0A166R9H9_9AGAM|nr:hypothetical protein FIBSPDRAFT_947954 [Fibularhizoctonia sp. CBS 109695]KZP28047.1 hypothetical protein FIBSPDRAFT_947955 [Fibularhizoctonia sp. CBS 109695]